MTNRDIEIEYDTFGDPDESPLLLIMGFTAQMTAWPEPFCAQLADAGHYVIRFDNRDCGLSSKTAGTPPNVMAMMMSALAGNPVEGAPYTLSDMAIDAMAVLDALEIDAAHVAGASMGGMIAQQTAIDHPDRVRSLVSIMSTTGDPSVGQGKPEVTSALLATPPADRDGAIRRNVDLGRVISGPLFDEELAREAAAAAYDRSFHPIGAAFQLAAMMASGDRTPRLRQLPHSTLVIHGEADPLITPSGGEATAEAIPGAELLMLEEMGHDLPRPLWPTFVEAIKRLTSAA